MTYGFFTPSEVKTKKTLAHSPQCGACKLYKNCRSPKMKYKGEGQKGILIVGESPGAEEDRDNEQFVGKAGKRLKYELKRVGIKLNRDCWKTNVRRCYVEGNPTPTSEEIRYCRPALFKEIKELRPKSIWLFGATAAEGVLGHLWKSDGKTSLAKWTDWIIPHQGLNAWISVHYHPSYLNRKGEKLLDLLANRQLKNAVKNTGRPWKKVPNYANNIEIIHKPSQVVKALQDIQSTFAFDYECNCIKPEYKGAEIVSCAVSDGERTYAYPWIGDAILATDKLLKSPLPKIASNAKFEERWTWHFLKHRVRNWDWDSMLAAHVLNNAKGITGLKFQSFVLLGQPAYDTHIEPYLLTSRGQHINRIRQLPIEEVLEYNGMDAFLEHKITNIQKRKMKCGS